MEEAQEAAHPAAQRRQACLRPVRCVLPSRQGRAERPLHRLVCLTLGL